MQKLFAMALLLTALYTPASRADTISATAAGITMSLETTNGSNITFVEGTQYVATFTVTNNTGRTINPTFAGGGFGYSSGDITDVPTTAFISNDNCRSSSLPNGVSCTEAIAYPTRTTPDLDFDFGVSNSGFGVGENNACSAGPIENCALLYYTLTVQDSATPEPSSSVLLGAGLLGLSLLIGARRAPVFTSQATPALADCHTASPVA